MAAWFLGWSVWSGTMALARDWDEIRRAAQLFVLCGAAILVVSLLSLDVFLPRNTVQGYLGGLVVLTGGMIVGYLFQEGRRPTPYVGTRP